MDELLRFVRLGDNWIRIDQIAAIQHDDRDASRIFLCGSNASIRVPLSPAAVIDRLKPQPDEGEKP